MTARAEDRIDWLAPDYTDVYRARADRLAKLRNDPTLLHVLRQHYRDSPADFINDWGVTVDPRAPERGMSSVMPFVLFPKQRELIDWLLECWRAADGGGVLEKSRDMGASWIAVSFSCTMCLFHRGITVGFGSRKEELVDSAADPDALFWKAREFMRYLPVEFRGGWDVRRHSAHRRIQFPETDSMMKGEAGDNIGRGGRSSFYFVDEAAHLERPKLVDASLSATTNCRIDMSSVNGMANSFAERRHKAGTRVFTYHYTADPRKGGDWAEKKQASLDAVIWAAEYEINYSASVEGIIIPAAWVASAIDAHIKLGITPSGLRRGALDVADAGVDKNAFVVGYGILVEHAESWKGTADLDIFHTVERAFRLCDEHRCDGFDYDADGLGAGVRGDARKINEARYAAASPRDAALSQRRVDAYRGSAGVYQPEVIVPGTDRTAGDMFENLKAQAWWWVRDRFKLTHRAVTGEIGPGEYDPGAIIAISSRIAELPQLKNELSQPTWGQSKSGKILVEKAPDGTLSPNIGDGLVIRYAPRAMPLNIGADVLDLFGRR